MNMENAFRVDLAYMINEDTMIHLPMGRHDGKQN